MTHPRSACGAAPSRGRRQRPGGAGSAATAWPRRPGRRASRFGDFGKVAARSIGGGFTLVEVLVALLIMSVMAMIGWQGVSGMVRAREISQQASERSLRLTAIIGQWEHDLQAVYDTPQVPGLAFDGAALRLVRRSGVGVQVVVWSLREGVWRRWAGPAVTRVDELQANWLRSMQLPDDDAAQLRLLDGVTQWQLYYWRGQGWSNAQSSGDIAAPPTQGAAARTLLPSGVRLQIDLPEGPLSRDVVLSPQSS